MVAVLVYVQVARGVVFGANSHWLKNREAKKLLLDPAKSSALSPLEHGTLQRLRHGGAARA